MLISVIICTHNRARLLEMSLERFRSLIIPEGLEWELLIIDNNSTDDTPNLVERFINLLPIRYILEPVLGQSRARNRAISEAKGELLLWTDDDGLVSPSWLKEYYVTALEFPDAQFFGGRVDPFFETPPPIWLQQNLSQLFAVYNITNLDGERPRYYRERESPNGVNMGIRAEVLRTFLFNEEIGLKGDNQEREDDVELFSRLRSASHKGVYIPTSRVEHFIPSERQTREYLFRWFVGNAAVSRRRMRVELERERVLFGLPTWALRSYIESSVAELLLRPTHSPRWFKHLKRSAFALGALKESLRGRVAGGSHL